MERESYWFPQTLARKQQVAFAMREGLVLCGVVWRAALASVPPVIKGHLCLFWSRESLNQACWSDTSGWQARWWDDCDALEKGRSLIPPDCATKRELKVSGGGAVLWPNLEDFGGRVKSAKGSVEGVVIFFLHTTPGNNYLSQCMYVWVDNLFCVAVLRTRR